MEQRTRENSLEARQTLMGIRRLVSKIKEMKVDERVKGMVEWSVAMLEAVRPFCILGSQIMGWVIPADFSSWTGPGTQSSNSPFPATP